MDCKVHRFRFYSPKPLVISCVSYNKHNKTLALARSDSSIEIWDLSYAPYQKSFIPGVENGSVEALGWVNERLLSTGLGGALIEWDLEKSSLKNTVLLTGYAAWCLDVNSSNTLVAVGTEQGYVNLYSVKNEDIVYVRIFDKQEGKIICCKFDNTGHTLVTGSVDTIRLWNVETGHAITRISAKRRDKETIVWCVALLSDNVIVSGDSLGRLTFWDGSIGDQIESYTTHKADILSIAVSDDERSIYCSGVDPVIMNFVKVKSGAGKQSGTQEKWVKNVQRHIHEHDVRALVINGEQLISVGADGYLTFSSYPPKWVMRIPPMIPVPRTSICVSKKLLLLRYLNHLELWRLGTYGTDDSGDVIFNTVSEKLNTSQKGNNNQLEKDSMFIAINKIRIENDCQKKILQLSENPIKLASITAKGKKQIRCCELSPTGEFIMYATDSIIRILKLDFDIDDDQTNASLCKVLLSGGPTSCDHAAFSEDSRLLLVHNAGVISVLHVDPDSGATTTQTITTNKYLKSSSILHLVISRKCPSGTTYLVVADSKSGIAIWAQKARKFEHFTTLPKYRCVPSALTVLHGQERLVIAYVDQKLMEYDLQEKKLSDRSVKLPEEWYSRRSAVLGLSPHPHRDALIVNDDTSLWILDDKNTDIIEQPVVKRHTHRPSQDSGRSHGVKIIPIKYLAGFHWLSEDTQEAVMVEVLPENIVSQLPPALAVKKQYLG